jgi:antitoxin component YwqK of YwqJK toxin-antitoxin module
MRTIFFLAVLAISACRMPNRVPPLVTLDKHWVDSIIKASDTSWIKPYRNNYFVTSEYYVDRKDSMVTQIMKDSAGTIRQVNQAKYDQVRLFYAEYFANGQLQAKLPLDSMGKYHGPAIYYYEDGTIKSSGKYEHGFYTGKWENFNRKGKLSYVEECNSEGQLMDKSRQ